MPNGDQPGISDTTEGGDNALQEQLAEVKQQLQELRATNEELHQELERTKGDAIDPEYLDYILQGGEKKTPVEEEDVDFDLLSNAELVKRLKKEREGSIKSLESTFSERIDSLENKLQVLAARAELELTKTRHPEFRERFKGDEKFRGRYIETLRRNPNMDCEEAWKYVRVQERIEREEQEAVSEEEKKKKLQAMTERGSAPAGAVAREGLSLAEAVEMANRENFGTE